MTSLTRQIARRRFKIGKCTRNPGGNPNPSFVRDGKHHFLHWTKGWRVTRPVNFDNEQAEPLLLKKRHTPPRRPVFKRLKDFITKPIRRWGRNK